MGTPSFQESKTVQTTEMTVEYFEFGSSAGAPLILLHGFPDADAAWRGVLAELNLDRRRVLVPYLRGFAGSVVSSPDRVGGQEAALGADVLRFADALGIRQFDLVGHDWGARASYAACIFAPERVRSLVTVASPYVVYGGKPYPPEQVRAHWYQWHLQLEQGRQSLERDRTAFCHELWRSWSPAWGFSEKEFAEVAKSWQTEQFIPIVLHSYRMNWGGTLSLRAYAELQALLEVKPKVKIAVPSVYIQGGSDACDLPPCSDDQASHFSAGYRRVLLKSAGHFPHREDPKAVAKVIRGMLARFE